jgi:hypothetical protein
MVKHGILAFGFLLGAAACEKRDNPPPPAERAAQAEKERAEAAVERTKEAAEATKDRAETAAEATKDRAEAVAEAQKDRAEKGAEAMVDRAEKTAERAEDKLEAIKDRGDVAWRAPDDGFRDDWAEFADGKDRTAEKGDWVIERGEGAMITAYRKVKQVSGEAFEDLKDAALVGQVKGKLAADEDTRAHKINVDADEHTVILRGEVGSAKEAGEAVRVALSAPGAERVISHLTWK